MRSAIEVATQICGCAYPHQRKADVALVQSYGDEREAKGHAKAIAEVVAWLRVQQHGRTSDNYPGYYARQIEAKFGGSDEIR